ncbi:MAG TPA: double-strand break repair protein AddB, partial [Pseudolabrys sp.]|nr:double-strand break repair protein AddB [Pseudolabrys sp.]
QGEAAILPRIVPLGDIDADELIFAQAAASGDLAQAALGLPETLSPFERRLLLAVLIVTWANTPAVRGAAGTPLVANTPAAAMALAADLAQLIDDMTTREVGWDKFDDLVRVERPDLDDYWKLSLRLLQVLRERWPQILHERGAIEPAARRDKLIAAETARLAASDAPVIAAGSTGSMPATATLLAAIAQHPRGALVLPGLDTALDEPSWQAIAGGDGRLPAFGHAQFAMQALLKRIGVARTQVEQLVAPKPQDAFVSEVLRPADSTDQWQAAHANLAGPAAAAVSSITLIEAANAEQEALAVAIVLREAANTAGKTAALVTPDRALAARVLAALERWNVPVDDSGGDSLADTPAGVFARLTAEVALGGLPPVALLALLKHPLLRLGAPADAHLSAVAALERAVLRGPRPKAGIAGLAHALSTYRAGRAELHRNDPRRLVSEGALAAAEGLVQALGEALAPLALPAGDNLPLATLAARHRDCVVALAGDANKLNAAFAGKDGEALALTFDEAIDTQAASQIAVAARDYPEFFHAALAARDLRMRERKGVRIRILGLLEARLQAIDRMVLGGLNEASWPPDVRSDPWLSRPMRLALGLDLPERRVGLAAHDFAQALGAKEVVLTRAAKSAGAPAVASRFLQRMAALAGAERWAAARRRGDFYLALAEALDAPSGKPHPVKRPEPSPPLEARPDKLSVTDIENWLRDPYTIYAKHVLDLHPLEAVATPPGAADRGSVIHEAIGKFTRHFAAGLPADPEQELIALGRQSFAHLEDYPEAKAFWWPRFLRIARWFAGWERERRPQLATVHGEIRGELKIPLGARVFTLSARADRIERRGDGAYAILDYKTGAPPTEPQVRTGLAPQLTLEAAILRGGGFADKGIAPGSVVEISYVRLRGGEPAGELKNIDFKDRGDPNSFADAAKAKLTSIAGKFLTDGEPYRSLVHPMWQKHYGEYDHLARVKEWAASGGESEADVPGSQS